MTERTILTVRQILGHFRATLETARRTSEPVIIALRGRQPAGVLLGYEAWEAGQAELAAARQRVAELEAQLVKPQPADPVGAGWRIEPSSEVLSNLPATWTGQQRGGSDVQESPVQDRWGRSSPQ